MPGRKLGQNHHFPAAGPEEITASTCNERRVTMIKKVKDGYKVLSEKSGKNLGGPYKTKAEAKRRLQQVEYFKRTKG